jgi:hypothetical protein
MSADAGAQTDAGRKRTEASAHGARPVIFDRPGSSSGQRMCPQFVHVQRAVIDVDRSDCASGQANTQAWAPRRRGGVYLAVSDTGY